MTITAADYVKAQMRVMQPRAGWSAVMLTDEDGCLLHTEPVCTFPAEWHGWFGDWIAKQDVPFKMLGLTDCPARLAKEKAKTHDGKCDDCWGSGWAEQFVAPCPTCKGTGNC